MPLLVDGGDYARMLRCKSYGVSNVLAYLKKGSSLFMAINCVWHAVFKHPSCCY